MNVNYVWKWFVIDLAYLVEWLLLQDVCMRLSWYVCLINLWRNLFIDFFGLVWFSSWDLLFSCRICIIAGNISPIDVITHVPILCEEANIPYVYVTSKEASCLLFCYSWLLVLLSSSINSHTGVFSHLLSQRCLGAAVCFVQIEFTGKH